MKMDKKVAFFLVIAQALGYIWHVAVYVVLIPFFLLLFSRGLDYLFFEKLLGLDLTALSALTTGEFAIVYKLFVLVLFSLGVLILLESLAIMYSKTEGFPFTVVPHKYLQPKRLAKSGPYGMVRHPMLLGYLIILLALGFYELSPSMVLWWVPLLGASIVEYYKVAEERKLADWFGEEYLKYRDSVPALIPRFGRSRA